MRVVRPNHLCKDNEIIIGMTSQFQDCSCSSSEKNMKNMQTKTAHIITIEDGKNIALPSVHIKNLTTGKGTLSDEKGMFSLTANASDKIQFSYMGKETLVMFFDKIPQVITMKETINHLPGVEVSAPKVSVTPSNNHKVKKSGKWIFWGSLAFVAGLFIFNKDDEKKKN